MKKVFLFFIVICVAVMVSTGSCFWDDDDDSICQFAIDNRTGSAITNIRLLNQSYPDVTAWGVGPFREMSTGTGKVTYTWGGFYWTLDGELEEGKFVFIHYGDGDWGEDKL